MENSWRVLRHFGTVPTTSYSFGEFTLDLERFRLERAGKTVHVERQVFDVLAYLIAHSDRVVPKTELLDNVWGDRFVSESALSSRIKAARRAVGDDGERQEVIRTVFGRGYQFVAKVGTQALPTTVAGPAPIDQEISFCHAPDGTRIAYSVVGSGSIARQGGKLADAPRLRPGEPGVAALDRGHRRRAIAAALRRAGLRHVGLGGGAIRLRRLGRGPRGRRRQCRARPLPAARRLSGRRRGRGVRRPPPRPREPHGALRVVRPRPSRPGRQCRAAARGGPRHRVGADRLGPRRSVVPPGLHVAVPARRQPRRVGRASTSCCPGPPRPPTPCASSRPSPTSTSRRALRR